MNRNLLIALASASMLLPLAACESGSSGSSMGSSAATKAMDMLPASVKDTINGYLGNMGDLNKALAGVTDQASAIQSVPKVSSLTDKISGYTKSLNSLSPDMQKTVKDAFSGQLASVTKGFESQVARLTGSAGGMSDYSTMLKPLLDKVSLFK